MNTKLTDAHLREVEENGYVIVERYLEEPRRARIAEALRRMLKPWNEVKDSPPEKRTDSRVFPFEEDVLNSEGMDDEAIRFAQEWFGTDRIHYRPRSAIVRYPGFVWGSNQAHQDNGNNSLLPPTRDRTHAQLWFWIQPEEVGEGQGPLHVIANKHGNDMRMAVPFIAPAGSLCIFHTHTWHSASDYTKDSGQRYSWGFAFGHADHFWEGVGHYTNAAGNPQFKKLVSSLTARQRELLRFPPAGHPYYNADTLDALEKWYPGWNARSEY